jgi:hypothetical protein
LRTCPFTRKAPLRCTFQRTLRQHPSVPLLSAWRFAGGVICAEPGGAARAPGAMASHGSLPATWFAAPGALHPSCKPNPSVNRTRYGKRRKPGPRHFALKSNGPLLGHAKVPCPIFAPFSNTQSGSASREPPPQFQAPLSLSSSACRRPGRLACALRSRWRQESGFRCNLRHSVASAPSSLASFVPPTIFPASRSAA